MILLFLPCVLLWEKWWVSCSKKNPSLAKLLIPRTPPTMATFLSLRCSPWCMKRPSRNALKLRMIVLYYLQPTCCSNDTATMHSNGLPMPLKLHSISVGKSDTISPPWLWWSALHVHYTKWDECSISRTVLMPRVTVSHLEVVNMWVRPYSCIWSHPTWHVIRPTATNDLSSALIKCSQCI